MLANRFQFLAIRRSTIWTTAIFLGVPFGFFYFSNSCSGSVQKMIEPIVRTTWDEVSNTGIEKKINFQPFFEEKISHICIQTPYSMSNEIARTASVTSLRIPTADEGEVLLVVIFATGYRKFCYATMNVYRLQFDSPCKNGAELTIKPSKDGTFLTL
jgi:hypothetical protein